MSEVSISGGAGGERHFSSIYITFDTAKFSQTKFSLKSVFSMALLMIKMADEVLNENISYMNLLYSRQWISATFVFQKAKHGPSQISFSQPERLS